MPHDARVLLEDVRHALNLIEQFTAGISSAEYASTDLLRAAVERKFILIGEALSRLEKLDSSVANQIPDFRKIIGFRNVLVHGYEAIDDYIVWKTVHDHLPILKNKVETLLAS